MPHHSSPRKPRGLRRICTAVAIGIGLSVVIDLAAAYWFVCCPVAQLDPITLID